MNIETKGQLEVGDEVEILEGQVNPSSDLDQSLEWGKTGDRGFVRDIDHQSLYELTVTRTLSTPFTGEAFWSDDVIVCSHSDLRRISDTTD